MSRRGPRSRNWSDRGSSAWCSGNGEWTRRCSDPIGPARHEIRRALGWSPEDTVISYVSRIAPEKNVDYLADALAIVAARRPDVRMLMVGDGPSRAGAGAAARGVGPFRRLQAGEDVADHYAASDIFAFSSLTETFGNVVLEAMASGLPVVALRAGGVGETVRHGDDRPPRRTHRAPRSPGRCAPVPGRAPGRAAAAGRSRPALCAEPELGRDHGRPAGALPVRRRAGRPVTRDGRKTRLIGPPASTTRPSRIARNRRG